MKTAGYLSVAMLGLFVVTTGAKADPADNPYIQTDGDGVPLAVSNSQSVQLSQEDIDEIHKEQAKAAKDKNWLMRNYEQQLKARAAAGSPEDQSSNLYYELSSNKDLAKLAGLPDIDEDDGGRAPTKQTGPIPPKPDSGPLVANSSPATSTDPFSLSPYNLKPLITPLSAPDAAVVHDFYSQPVSTPSPVSDGTPQTTPAPKTDQSQDPSDIETPGMIAAKKDPLSDTDTPDLTLNVLPGETIEQAKEDRAKNDEQLELPLPMNAAQLHKAQTAALTVPSPTTSAQITAATPAPSKTLPTEDLNAPIPVSQELPINPIRAPIANPYDVLNR